MGFLILCFESLVSGTDVDESQIALIIVYFNFIVRHEVENQFEFSEQNCLKFSSISGKGNFPRYFKSLLSRNSVDRTTYTQKNYLFKLNDFLEFLNSVFSKFRWHSFSFLSYFFFNFFFLYNISFLNTAFTRFSETIIAIFLFFSSFYSFYGEVFICFVYNKFSNFYRTFSLRRFFGFIKNSIGKLNFFPRLPL